MREPVQQGSRQPLGAERFCPFVERQIAGHQRGATLIAPAEDLGQQFGAGLGRRHEAQFADDQQLKAGKHFLKAHQAPFVLGLDQFVRQRRRGREPDAEASLASGQSEGERDMRFFGAQVSQRQDVFLALDELAAGQIQHQRLIQGWDRQELESIQAFDHVEQVAEIWTLRADHCI